ncbi:MAG: YbaK/EbsC family protein [Candidatus Omnitrophica bacterium]|nr:YbaK/EbsC family protein [Candidatus Omnitrophota bacterium]MDD5311396.1 YbaK/EbsC family protein [Candidatus Omnitrophota bacterium]MDD5546866.1 YbaK/EbsC family protein [Candidatus Omnitrophota bacterium]
MAIAAKLKKYLDSNKVKYKALKHKLAYTAQEIAAAQEVPGKQVVKSVLVKAGDRFVLAVLPAIHLIDAKKLKAVLKCKSIKIATEKDIKKVIPDYKPGAMPPFGNLFGLETCADKMLKEDVEIVFNGGTHTDTVKMKYADFEKLAKPKISDFGKHV